MRSVLTLLCILGLAAASCAPSRTALVEAALMADEPPPDFSLAVNVLRPVPLGAIINARTDAARPSVQRPASYIIEADAILRVAVGYGASEKTFPPETRQLTAAQYAELWRSLRDSSLVDPDHPDRTGRLPTLEEFTRATEGRGGYTIAFSMAHDRRVLAIDEAAPAARDARDLVASLLALAWVRPADAELDPQSEPAP